MCGRYYVADEEDIIEIREIIREVNERYRDTAELAMMKTGEVFPTDVAPVLALEQNRKRAQLMKWGFPRYDGAGVVINARAETASEKPMFRGILSARRCIVPSTGFFEWAHNSEGEDGSTKKKKEKYLLTLPNERVLNMAGLYNSFMDKDGQTRMCYVILTTAANESVAPIHNRMPVILTGDRLDLWLHDEAFAQALMRESSTQTLIRSLAG